MTRPEDRLKAEAARERARQRALDDVDWEAVRESRTEWISERDIDDQIAGRHYPLNDRGSSE